MNEFKYIFHVFESKILFQSVGFSSVFVSDCCVPFEVNDMQLLFYNSLREARSSSFYFILTRPVVQKAPSSRRSSLLLFDEDVVILFY